MNVLLGNILNSTQISNLLNIKYPNSNMVILNNTNLDIQYQIVSLIKKIGYDQTVSLMTGNSILKDTQLLKNALGNKDEGKSDTPVLNKTDIDEAIMYGAQMFSDVHKSYQNNAKILKEPTLTSVGATDCVKCGSGNTTTTVKQTRAADEASVSFNRCKICNFKWKT
jgi:DNA-directed RNA polymerase subunit M/transcription elongation factor TFIIS